MYPNGFTYLTVIWKQNFLGDDASLNKRNPFLEIGPCTFKCTAVCVDFQVEYILGSKKPPLKGTGCYVNIRMIRKESLIQISIHYQAITHWLTYIFRCVDPKLESKQTKIDQRIQIYTSALVYRAHSQYSLSCTSVKKLLHKCRCTIDKIYQLLINYLYQDETCHNSVIFIHTGCLRKQ